MCCLVFIGHLLLIYYREPNQIFGHSCEGCVGCDQYRERPSISSNAIFLLRGLSSGCISAYWLTICLPNSPCWSTADSICFSIITVLPVSLVCLHEAVVSFNLLLFACSQTRCYHDYSWLQIASTYFVF